MWGKRQSKVTSRGDMQQLKDIQKAVGEKGYTVQRETCGNRAFDAPPDVIWKHFTDPFDMYQFSTIGISRKHCQDV